MPDLRYARQEQIPDWNQQKLSNAKVLIVGCGALGNEVAKNLSLLGIGSIYLLDYDTIEKHNLTRSVLFRESDIGRTKTEVIAQRIQELNPSINVYQINGKLEQALGRGLLKEMDAVLGCLDSVNARRELNKRCYFSSVPWIDGGISHLGGNVALFDPKQSDTACYRCKMNSSAWERYNERYSCGLLKDNYREKTLTTTIMSASIIAAYMSEITVQLLISGKSNFSPGTQLYIPVSQPHGFRTINFSLDEQCPDHEDISLDSDFLPIRASLQETPREIALKLELSSDWQMELPFEFLSEFICDRCGYVESIRTPVKEVKKKQVSCPLCHADNRQMNKFFRINRLSREGDFSFNSFGICDREIIKFSDKDGFHFVELFASISDNVLPKKLPGNYCCNE